MKKLKKCKICRTNLRRRYCIRVDKYLCTLCCNDMRVDSKCPKTCKYHAEKFANYSENPIKVDSMFELLDLQEKKIRRWMLEPSDLFNGVSPRVLKETESGREEIREKLRGVFPDIRLTRIYEKVLGIDLGSIEQEFKINHEEVALNFLSLIIEEKWDSIPPFFEHKDDKTVDIFINRLKKRKELINLNYFLVYASGLSSDRLSCFCSAEINYQTEMSLIFIYHKEKWSIDNIIFGGMELYFTQGEALKRIAISLNNKLNLLVLTPILEAENIYYLSPDIQYYLGLFYALQSKNKIAMNYFEEAIRLDPRLTEAFFNLAFLYQSEKKLEKAKELYQKTLSLQPTHIDALNNLGTIYIWEKEFDKARLYFQKCLDINPDYKGAIENMGKVEK